MKKTLFVTGVSTGLGRALAEVALAEGHRVAGTLRNESARLEFERLKPGEAFGKLLDMTDFAAIPGLVADVERTIGAIDVLVNNAGYGHEGIVEESSLEDLRRQFDVNVFGAVAMMQAVLPHMRERRSGHIVNITSMGGIVTFPGVAFYHGSKFALEGISESLGKEVAGFNIHVTAVAPGMFRTDWAGRSLKRTERKISDYDGLFDPLRARRRNNSGKQSGDPKKAARAILALIASERPPAHLLLGPDAVRLVTEKLDTFKAEIEAWKAVSTATDFS